MLLSNTGMQQSALACDHCDTGPASCQAAQKCQAAVLTDGATNQFVFAKSTSTATLVSKEKDCYLDAKALAIGGGGLWSGTEGNYGAGGSGYVEFGVLRVKANQTLNLQVGTAGQTSSIERDGQVLLLATAGHKASGNSGGDGYSGGGGALEDGGEDGGDAEDHGGPNKGGHGSGLDIGSVNMTKFTLSPGKAGVVTGSWGGGGGGIIVNGEKPTGQNHHGEGFGGGAGFVGEALPGCVLIEV